MRAKSVKEQCDVSGARVSVRCSDSDFLGFTWCVLWCRAARATAARPVAAWAAGAGVNGSMLCDALHELVVSFSSSTAPSSGVLVAVGGGVRGPESISDCCVSLQMFATAQKTQELWMWKMEYLHHEQRPLYFGEWF